MRALLILLLSTGLFAQKKSYQTPYEIGNGNQTATYQEVITFYRSLEKDFGTLKVIEMGATDSGEPLHIIIYNSDKILDISKIHDENAVLLINNGIHPGEPDGIDATMMLYRDLATGKIKSPDNVAVVTIPVYNIGGMLNRNSHSRANQNGPESYGFRGNGRNYDLNRDFVKSDTRNARSFTEAFHKVKPDIFIDNHVSNGADYQYVFTYVATHHQKLGGGLGAFWKDEMIPEIMAAMRAKGIESTPYVNVHDTRPDDAGFEQFMDHPRYSTGYASMFNVPGSMPETHMLKDYAPRVKATYEYMVETIAYMNVNHSKIRELRINNLLNYAPGKPYTLRWVIDSTKVAKLPFLGYEGSYKTSEVTGKQRLYYDRSKPFSKELPYYQTYKPETSVIIPEAYIIPKSWWSVVELLKFNNIEVTPLASDRLIEVESYRIGEYVTNRLPYEGHYPHSDVKLEKKTEKILFHKGDLLVTTRQPGVKYLLETLEPQGADSFFNWNFFDAILQQKEYFSAYVFEDTAKKILDENPALKKEFDAKKQKDKAFADSADAQLDWIYRQSPYYEKSHLQYPVYRMMKPMQ